MTADLHHLRYFLVLSEQLNFRKAAEILHISQPALSRQIARVESEMGVELLHRTSRDTKLTPAGQVYAQEVREILFRLSHAGELARSTSKNQVQQTTVGYTPATVPLLVKAMRVFQQRLSPFRIAYRVCPTNQMVEFIHGGLVDCAVSIVPGVSDQVESEIVGSQGLFVVMKKRHRLAAYGSVPVHEWAKEPQIVPPRSQNPFIYDLVTNLARNVRTSMNIAHTVENLGMRLQLISEGFGVSLVFDSNRTPRTDVAFRPLKNSPKIAVAVTYSPIKKPPIVPILVELLRKVTAKMLLTTA